MSRVLEEEVVLTGFYTKENPTVRFDFFNADDIPDLQSKGYTFTNPEDFAQFKGKPEIKYEN